MGRWQPDASGRLGQAATELYLERGFEQTTVAEIAERAGLTERTFFRYFADKREVLFERSGELQELMVAALAATATDIAPIEALAISVHAAAELLQQRGDHARQRQSLIEANPVLQERELIKMATLSAALADTLRGRGLADPAARLLADAGISVFRIGFERWVAAPDGPDLTHFMSESFAELRAVTSET